MNLPSRIVNAVTTRLVAVDAAGLEAFDSHRRRIPGWSTYLHYLFFQAVVHELFADPRKVPALFIGGVYHGLDLTLLASLIQRHYPGREYRLVGCDLFSSEPCADWPADRRHLTWEQAFGCPPPSLAAAAVNCPSAELVPASAGVYLGEHANRFDFIYLDTSHDEATVRGEITAALLFGTPGQLLAGDDYSGAGGYVGGVSRAVDALLPDHLALFDTIWLAQTQSSKTDHGRL